MKPLRRFPVALAVVATVGLGLRVAYVRSFSSHIRFGLDALWYELVAGTVASAHGYVDPSAFYGRGVAVPTAFRPPMFPLFLAGVIKVADESQRTFQYAGCVLGAIAIVLIGLLGRRLGGRRVGIVAAALAAVSPALIAVDASVMSETLYVPLVAGFLLAVYAAIDRPSPLRWALVGLLAGAAVLTRGDALVLTAVVIVPALWLLREVPASRRVVLGLATFAVALAVVTPWLGRNQQQLGSPTLATLDAGTAVAGTNCDATYYGSLLGSWAYECTHPETTDRAGLDEARVTRDLEHDGLTYARDHASRVPLVVAARIARQWGLWNPVSESRVESVESRNTGWQLVTWFVYVPCAVLAVYGLVVLRRRKVRVQPLVCVIVAVTLSAALTYGKQRLRIAAEPVILVCAAVALVELLGPVSRRRRASTRHRRPDRSSTGRADGDAVVPMPR